MTEARRPDRRFFRYVLIGIVLLLGVYWSIASAGSGAGKEPYPEEGLLVTGRWLAANMQKIDKPVVVDVRTDEHFDGKLIPGALRLPWSLFRYTDTARGIGGRFVGIAEAQRILGEKGIARTDSIVLYDSVARDGGATASYVFWVLDLLGHPDKKILERGIDGWIDAGGETTDTPGGLERMLYQAPSDEIDLQRWADGGFIRKRLGDPYYQIIDVRSREEYLGEKANMGIEGRVLDLGHVPTAVNVDYRLNWSDGDTKAVKSYARLLELYRGLAPDKAVITYCHSGRRSSFSYFILRLMGFEDVRLYDDSWFEWGNPAFFFPVETRENRVGGGGLPRIADRAGTTGAAPAAAEGRPQRDLAPEEPKGGYISCGG